MIRSSLLTLLLSSSLVYSHPFFGPNYPRFHDEGRPNDPQTVNVYKIYAPRIFYMNGYKPDSQDGDTFDKRSKQMIPSSSNSIDEMIRSEMFGDEVFDGHDNSIMPLPENMTPKRSNIVSRKMPDYGQFSSPQMIMDSYEPPQHPDDFDPYRFGPGPRPFIPEFFDDFQSEEFSHHPSEPDFHAMRNGFNNPIDNEIIVADFRFPEPHGPIEDFIPESPVSAKFNTRQPMPFFTPLAAAGPLTSMINQLLSGQLNKMSDDKIKTEVITTFSLGQPEIIDKEKKSGSLLEPYLQKPQNGVNQLFSKVNIPMQDVAAVIIEEEDDLAPVEDFRTFVEGDDSDESDIVEEVERNFVKTILPDNSVVTTEVNSDAPKEKINTIDDDNVEEVDINIVKTILPDDSYLLSEAGGEDEKIQDEVINMIQEHPDAKIGDISSGTSFISAYLDTPEE